MERSEELNRIINEVYASYEVQYGNAIVDLIQRIDNAIEYINYMFDKGNDFDIIDYLLKI